LSLIMPRKHPVASRTIRNEYLRSKQMSVKFDLAVQRFEELLGAGGKALVWSARAIPHLFFDCLEYVLYRQRGLRKFERLLLHPEEITWGFVRTPPHHFGVVRRKFWDLPRVPVSEAIGGIPKNCLKRLLPSQSWESSGEFERVQREERRKGNPYLANDPRFFLRWQQRFEALDALIDDVKREGTLQTRDQLDSLPFRERGGVGIVINEDGSISLCDGHHRFGLSLGLGVQRLPVALFAVHPEFVKSGKWKTFYETHRFISHGPEG
jgi:hypothetical protein